jgi:hypothetical protein
MPINNNFQANVLSKLLLSITLPKNWLIPSDSNPDELK